MEQENNNNGKTAGAAGSMQTIEETDNDVFLTDEELTNRILERIDELENNGPAGLLEIIVISSFTNKPIRIKFLNNTKYLIGYDQDNESQASLHLNYQEPTSNGGSSGHWYIEDFESDTENDRNNCLFKSVGCQISQRASELRYATIRELRENIPEVVRFIRDFEEEEDEDIFTYMLGGARYPGGPPPAGTAGRILDNSQGQRNDMNDQPGHPRGHASNPGHQESVENYSRNDWKTAFQSIDDQNRAAHQSLQTPQAESAMERLNQGGQSQTLHIDASTLQLNGMQCLEFRDGQAVGGPQPIRSITIVLRHHRGRSRDEDHDVFVHTIYPRIR